MIFHVARINVVSVANAFQKHFTGKHLEQMRIRERRFNRGIHALVQRTDHTGIHKVVAPQQFPYLVQTLHLSFRLHSANATSTIENSNPANPNTDVHTENAAAPADMLPTDGSSARRTATENTLPSTPPNTYSVRLLFPLMLFLSFPALQPFKQFCFLLFIFLVA